MGYRSRTCIASCVSVTSDIVGEVFKEYKENRPLEDQKEMRTHDGWSTQQDIKSCCDEPPLIYRRYRLSQQGRS